MLKDITLGQYYQTESVLHSMDPRVKITGTLVFIISLFITQQPLAYIIAGIYLATLIFLSRVPFSYMIRGMRAIIFILLFTMIFNLFLTPGDPLWEKSIGSFTLRITVQGLETCIYMAIRLCMLIIGSSIMTLTTTPNRLTDGLESLMKPLQKIGVPVHEIAMMMAIALRFIPILMEETDKIMKAQMARCADFESGGIIQKAKSLVPLLVPLFVSAFRRANDLAMAMEARCYRGGEGRTRMKILRYGSLDYSAYIILLLYLALIIASGRVYSLIQT